MHAHIHLQELAWASYALLRNTNSCAVVVFHQGQVAMCRGQLSSNVVGSRQGDMDAVLAAVTDSMRGSSQLLEWGSARPSGGSSSSSGEGTVYCPDKAAIGREGLSGAGFIPAGVQALLLQPLAPYAAWTSSASSGNSSGGGGGWLMLLSERERAFSKKELAWAEALAAKLADVLLTGAPSPSRG
jgi:hypothetical protein